MVYSNLKLDEAIETDAVCHDVPLLPDFDHFWVPLSSTTLSEPIVDPYML
jgi:hypothetical protein